MTEKNIEKVKGRAEEAAGALTGDKSLKNHGRADQVKAAVKKTVDKVTGRDHDEEPAAR